jgi:hypothetical protein
MIFDFFAFSEKIKFIFISMINIIFKLLGPPACSAEVTTFRVMHYIGKGQKLFFRNIEFLGIKRRWILRRFQKYKTCLSEKKCTYNMLFKENSRFGRKKTP